MDGNNNIVPVGIVKPNNKRGSFKLNAIHDSQQERKKTCSHLSQEQLLKAIEFLMKHSEKENNWTFRFSSTSYNSGSYNLFRQLLRRIPIAIQ